MDSSGRPEEMIPLKEPADSDGKSIRNGDLTVRTVLKFIFAVVVLLFLILVIFLGGLLTGHSVFCSVDKCEPPSTSAPPNWGASAIVDGETVSVTQWLDTELGAENIRQNLRLEYCIPWSRSKFPSAITYNLALQLTLYIYMYLKTSKYMYIIIQS